MTVNLLQPKASTGAGFGPITIGILSSWRKPFPQPRPSAGFPQNLFSATLRERVEGALRWELVRLFDSGQPKSEAVLRYLAAAEIREVNPHLADDVRIAWLTVLHAAADVADAWGYSFWRFFGKTYPKALLAWAERDEVNRKALERCAAMVRQAREGSPLSGEGAEKSASALPRGESLGRAHPVPVVSPIGGEAAGDHEVPKPHGNLYDSARAVLEFPSPKDRKRAA